MIKNIKGIYAIKDEDMGFVDIISFSNDQIAERKFLEVCKSGNAGDMTKYPEKFSLWRLGGYDDETGELTPNLKKIIDAPKEEKTEKEEEAKSAEIIDFPTNTNK